MVKTNMAACEDNLRLSTHRVPVVDDSLVDYDSRLSQRYITKHINLSLTELNIYVYLCPMVITKETEIFLLIFLLTFLITC